MKRWSEHRIRAVLLTLLLALGMSFTSVQGGLMAAEMIVSAEASGASGCDDCGGDAGDAGALTCLSVCGLGGQGLLPGEPMATAALVRPIFRDASPLLGGRANRPDHGPPKILILG